MTCDEEVDRRGELQPCDLPAVALRHDPEDGAPYPVCKRHTRGDMVPLGEVVCLVAGHRWSSPERPGNVVKCARCGETGVRL